MQPAGFAHQLVAGTQKQVIGVAQDDFRADFLEFLRRHALDGGCVPTGMNAGVSMVPCGVWTRPSRAPLLAQFDEFVP
jgi:hypothetical protein